MTGTIQNIKSSSEGFDDEYIAEGTLLSDDSTLGDAPSEGSRADIPRFVPHRVVKMVRPQLRFAEEIKQRFDGIVLEVNSDEVITRISDVENKENPDELATFAIEEFDERDEELLQPGSQFYWHIGYTKGNKLPKQRFSKIRFKRLPSWSLEEIEIAKCAAKEEEEYFAD